jgi:ribosomal protein S18 acetylase RimI-like enzyme
VAIDSGEVVAYAAVMPGVAWSSHVGELRLIVAPSHRRRGLGHTVARHCLASALEDGLAKVVVEVVADQASTISLFQGLGFVVEALLADHVLDADGNLHDLVVLSHHADDIRSMLATMGLDQPLA